MRIIRISIDAALFFKNGFVMNAILALKSEKTKIVNSVLDTKTNAEVAPSQFNFQSLYTFFINRLTHFRKKVICPRFTLFGLSKQTTHQYNTNVLSIEISSEKMETLLAFHHICAADVRCLNANSKQCLQKLCLKTCLNKMHSYRMPHLLDNDQLTHQYKREHYD